MIMTGTISAQSLSGFPSMIKSLGARKSQQKYPTMARMLIAKISTPKVLSFVQLSPLELNA
ncbi:MAG: hypothetical protein AOA66_0297 [Candidatus Bathyarchaeota archaeon BA2]|nr:MAG: hypothetical protein AOA66_0297 [Candidatus Bathyarchaeota archaeon BA2]